MTLNGNHLRIDEAAQIILIFIELCENQSNECRINAWLCFKVCLSYMQHAWWLRAWMHFRRPTNGERSEELHSIGRSNGRVVLLEQYSVKEMSIYIALTPNELVSSKCWALIVTQTRDWYRVLEDIIFQLTSKYRQIIDASCYEIFDIIEFINLYWA